jgi:zinc/manganese transport system permease protein
MDWTIFQFLAPAIAASLIIAGIHAYLGLHVVERGVIFVDLSLAQIASLGAAIAVWRGVDAHDPLVYWMSLTFTLIGAFIFAMVKGKEAHIPQEAIIGISYAVASAAVILTLSKATGEAEHLQSMLVGNILSVQWNEVLLTAGIYVIIGLFHYIFRQRFLDISMDPDAVAARGISVRFWDFLFYASFGLVVTRSVAIAGVLLVFCYLIVPSIGGMLFARRIGPRLAVAWIMGVVVSMLGMYFSVQFDLPTGAAIVCTFGLVLAAMAAVRPLFVRLRASGNAKFKMQNAKFKHEMTSPR